MLWLLEKYANMDKNSTWNLDIKKEDGALYFQQKNNQLHVIQNNEVIDKMTLPISGKGIRGISKGAILVIIDERTLIIRRLRFKFASTENKTDIEHCLKCTNHLKNFFSFKEPCAKPATTTHIAFKESFRALVQRHTKILNGFPAPVTLPDDLELEEALKLCILDEGFPDIVERVEALLKSASFSS